jgi:hypothetical protein
VRCVRLGTERYLGGLRKKLTAPIGELKTLAQDPKQRSGRRVKSSGAGSDDPPGCHGDGVGCALLMLRARVRHAAGKMLTDRELVLEAVRQSRVRLASPRRN